MTLARRQLLQYEDTLGLGTGIFVLGIVLLVSVVLCCCGSNAKKPGVVYVASTALFVAVFVILLAAPKGEKEESPAQGYDDTVVPLGIILSVMVLGAILSLAGMFIFYCQPTTYARPLSYHTDILMNR
ncbi:hypothetical protein BSKO_08105 [Bryopsis sp. KO-2023]|nr:hypothetical protein BSKO_08105 [Bryopsis sp. KO-2023]